jgi:glycine cleavage system H protein
MSHLPNDLKYAETHEWAKLEVSGLIRVGITDFAQEQLGDVVFVDLPAVGAIVKAGAAIAVIESVKAASDIHAPVAGEIVEINPDLAVSPERVNEQPYEAWMFCIRPSDISDLDRLMDALPYGTSAGL